MSDVPDCGAAIPPTACTSSMPYLGVVGEVERAHRSRVMQVVQVSRDGKQEVLRLQSVQVGA